MSIITMLLPIAVRVFGFFLDKSAADKKAKEDFLRLVDTLQEQNLVSKDLYMEDVNQLKDLEEQFKGQNNEPN